MELSAGRVTVVASATGASVAHARARHIHSTPAFAQARR
jgi:hypothetical protein